VLDPEEDNTVIILNVVPSRPTTERHIPEDKDPQILVISAVGQFKLNRLGEKNYSQSVPEESATEVANSFK